MAKHKAPMVDVVVRFRVQQGEGPLSPEAVIDRLMRNGFEAVMDHEPKTHAAIESWQMVPDYKQFLADAMAWRGYQARRKRLTSAGFGKSPLRQEK